MDLLTVKNLSIEVAIKEKAKERGCIYDRGSSLYPRIDVESNVLHTDLDGFLLDSQAAIYEAAGEIDPQARPGLKKDIEERMAALVSDNANISNIISMAAKEQKLSGEAFDEYVEAMLKQHSRYQLNMQRLKEVNDDMAIFKKHRDDVLCGRNPKKIDYRGIYATCPIDEDACKLIEENVGPGKLFTTAIATSHYNDDTEIAKIERLRKILSIPVLLIPWPGSKVGTVVDISGVYNFKRSLIADDDVLVITDTQSRYSNMQVSLKENGMTTCQTLEEGFQKVKTA